MQVLHPPTKPARPSHLMRLIRAELIETEVGNMHNLSYHQRVMNISPFRIISIMSNRSRGAGVEGVAKSLLGTVFGQRNFFTKRAYFPYPSKPEYHQFAQGNR